MKKTWAILCVIAFTAFWVFGFLALSGLVSDRPFDWISTVIAVVGLGVGTFARTKINVLTSNVKQGLHVRPTQGQDEYAEKVHA
jgi:hypothetical protein